MEEPHSPPHDSKRRRVTRACDSCRNKKVKCDGKQPCIHCTVYSYNCTYDQPNIRNKRANPPLPSTNSSNQILKKLSMRSMPSFPSPAPSSVTSSSAPSSAGGGVGSNAQNLLHLLFPRINFATENGENNNNNSAFDMQKFQRVVAYLQAKNPGNINVHEILELYLDAPTPKASPIESLDPHSVTSASSHDDDYLACEFRIILPPKHVSLQLIFTTWSKACVLFRFYHRPSLLEEVDLLYSLDPSQYTDRQQKFLPFMYSILACGSLFSRSPYNAAPNNGELEDDGFRYFNEARKLIDITNVGDIPSIQTIVMMIIYLQCSARLSTCYCYIGIALRSALKEGLHRNLSIFQSSKRKLDPIEVDTRKRLFYTIYKMDIYINSLLGLPRSISEDEYDQEFPVELDDELITRDAYLFDSQQGRLSSSGCANHHTKLIIILSHIVRELYPIKIKPKLKNPAVTDKLHDKVTDLEFELKQWLDGLPPELKPTDPSDPESSKKIPERLLLANYYLHLSFLNCQNNLYRPFIHYISNGYQASNSDPRSLIRGRNCIKVARMVVKLANKMIDQHLLLGTYWFSMYTIFFSIACLIYYFHFANYNNQNTNQGVNYAGVLFDDDLNIEMIRKDIEIGRKVLDTLKNMSPASSRIYNILNKLFEQLNRRTADTSMGTNFMNGQSFEANDKTVQLTLINFDRINDFSNGQNSDYGLMDRQKSENAESKDNDAFPEGNREGEPQDNQGNQENQGNQDESTGKSSQKGNSAEVNELYDVFTNGVQKDSATDLDKSDDLGEVPFNNYMPGVIDTVDTQIFGRILPPYMLEGNLKRQVDNMQAMAMAQSGNQPPLGFRGPQTVQPGTQPPGSVPPSQSGEVKKEDTIGQDEFFKSLGMQGLEQPPLEGAFDSLDPFNPSFL